jgi:hypothetical protein
LPKDLYGALTRPTGDLNVGGDGAQVGTEPVKDWQVAPEGATYAGLPPDGLRILTDDLEAFPTDVLGALPKGIINVGAGGPQYGTEPVNDGQVAPEATGYAGSWNPFGGLVHSHDGGYRI